jgi:PPP family 3-phenylpropionic acid transporter
MKFSIIKNPTNFQASLIIFFFYSSAGALFPIFNLLFQEKGFTIAAISYLLVIPNLFNLFAGPLWASIADIFNIHKRVLTLTMALTIPFIIALNFTKSYSGTMVIFSLFAFSFAPLLTMTDNAVLNILGNDQHQFGRIRVWGSISYGLSAWLVGLLTDHYGINIAYWISALAMVVTIIITWNLPTKPAVKTPSFWDNFYHLMKDKSWLFFLAGVFMAGYGQSLIMGYFPALIKDLGAKNSLIGLAIYISAISEIPIMIFSPYFFKKISLKKLFLISFFALILRNLGYILFGNMIPIIFTQLLHGLTSSLFWITAILYARSIAPEGLKATSLAILGAIYYGLAGLTGSFLGGQIYSKFGPIVMFQTGLLLAFIGTLIFLLKIKNVAPD